METIEPFLNKYIDRYTMQLFKKNINYIFITIFFIALNFYIFTFQILNYYALKDSITAKEEELRKVTSQREIVAKYNKQEIDKLYQAISLLVPNKEDYFSIISAVENLSTMTGLEVLSYSVVFSSSTSEKIVLKVEAKGDIESLKRFLDEYRFKGGRLITMDKIEFSNRDFRSTLDLNFYTRKVALKADEDVKVIDPATLSIFQQVSDTILRDNQQISQQAVEEEYETKTNPFGR